MCIHREHPFATGGIVEGHESLRLIGGEGTDCVIPRPDMPQLWSDDGDDL